MAERDWRKRWQRPARVIWAVWFLAVTTLFVICAVMAWQAQSFAPTSTDTTHMYEFTFRGGPYYVTEEFHRRFNLISRSGAVLFIFLWFATFFAHFVLKVKVLGPWRSQNG